MAIERILDRLEGVANSGEQYRAKCPSHQGSSQNLYLKETKEGMVLLFCHAGCSAGEVLEAIDMKLSDIYDQPTTHRERPLYMATQEKKKLATIYDKIKSCQLRLDMAKDMRERGMILTAADKKTERESFMLLRQLQEQTT